MEPCWDLQSNVSILADGECELHFTIKGTNFQQFAVLLTQLLWCLLLCSSSPNDTQPSVLSVPLQLLTDLFILAKVPQQIINISCDGMHQVHSLADAVQR